MIEKFKNLPAAQQQDLIDACLDEFGGKGYTRASTNIIVRNAGIPKGTLFYFFGNKKNLFLYLMDYTVGKYVQYVETQSTSMPSDLFERLLHLSSVRMRFAAHAPKLYKFFFKTLLNVPDDLKADMQERFQLYADGNRQLMSAGLDTSRMREGVSVDQVLGLLNYFLEGLLASHAEQLTKMSAVNTIAYVENLLDESMGYFDLIKRGVYTD